MNMLDRSNAQLREDHSVKSGRQSIEKEFDDLWSKLEISRIRMENMRLKKQRKLDDMKLFHQCIPEKYSLFGEGCESQQTFVQFRAPVKGVEGIITDLYEQSKNNGFIRKPVKSSTIVLKIDLEKYEPKKVEYIEPIESGSIPKRKKFM
jgi:hypothetical protein